MKSIKEKVSETSITGNDANKKKDAIIREAVSAWLTDYENEKKKADESKQQQSESGSGSTGDESTGGSEGGSGGSTDESTGGSTGGSSGSTTASSTDWTSPGGVDGRIQGMIHMAAGKQEASLIEDAANLTKAEVRFLGVFLSNYYTPFFTELGVASQSGSANKIYEKNIK